MKTETNVYNPFDYLLTDAEIGDYLSQAFLEDDPAIFVTALSHAVKHKGVAFIADKTGLNRESLYKTLSGKTQPTWNTVQRIMKALEIKLQLVT